MTRHHGRWLAGLAAAVSVAVAACATFGVNSYRWPGADFGRYRTFGWQADADFSTGDPRLDNNRIFRARIQTAVERELSPRGLERTALRPDLLIHVHARVEQRLERAAIDTTAANCEREECGPYAYEAGTLLLDFVDARTNDVVWRGWAEGSLNGVIDNQDLLEERVDQAVAKILARLPR